LATTAVRRERLQSSAFFPFQSRSPPCPPRVSSPPSFPLSPYYHHLRGHYYHMVVLIPLYCLIKQSMNNSEWVRSKNNCLELKNANPSPSPSASSSGLKCRSPLYSNRNNKVVHCYRRLLWISLLLLDYNRDEGWIVTPTATTTARMFTLLASCALNRDDRPIITSTIKAATRLFTHQRHNFLLPYSNVNLDQHKYIDN